MKKNKCKVLQKLLVEGWFDNEKEAVAWVMERKVLANEVLITSVHEMIPETATIRIKGEYKRKYVNKGGLKLEGALRDLKISVQDKVALDCGASTGGFTDCLLQSGASMVYAVDVGYGQLAGKLMINPKVRNMEKTNLGDEVLTSLEPKPEVITLDLSYLSLKKAVPICKNILSENGTILCLVKPTFELGGNVVKLTDGTGHYEQLRLVLEDLCSFFIEEGFSIFGVTNSSVTGNEGTIEYFIAITRGSVSEENKTADYHEDISAALTRSYELSQFKK